MARKKKIEIRVSALEHKRYTLKCDSLNLSLSEFVRQSFEENIAPRLTEPDRDLLRSLILDVNKWQNVTNMFRKRDPKLGDVVQELVNDMRTIIHKNFNQ